MARRVNAMMENFMFMIATKKVSFWGGEVWVADDGCSEERKKNESILYT